MPEKEIVSSWSFLGSGGAKNNKQLLKERYQQALILCQQHGLQEPQFISWQTSYGRHECKIYAPSQIIELGFEPVYYSEVENKGLALELENGKSN